MLNLFSRMLNAPLVLPFCLWLLIFSSSCQAFHCPNTRSLRRSLDTTKLHGFFSPNITRSHHDVVDETFRGTFNQTDDSPPNSLSNTHKPIDGKSKNDRPVILLSSVSDISRQFPKHCSKSWSNLVYGFRYNYRNLFPISLWHLLAVIPSIILTLLLHWPEHLSPTKRANVIRVFGNFMFHTSSVVNAAVTTTIHIFWPLFPRFHWQQNQVYLKAVFHPIWEEIVYRLMLYRLWQWIERAYIHFHGKLQGESKEHRSSFMSLLKHKYSFRVLSSLIFGLSHIPNYYDLWETNEINHQLVFILMGMFHAFAAFFLSLLCLIPLFETRGVMAAIGAHSAFNMLTLWKDGRLGLIMFCLAPLWAIMKIGESAGDGMSAVIHKLTPPQPSRVD